MKTKQKECNVRLCRPPMGGVLRLRVASCLLGVVGPKMLGHFTGICGLA